MNTLKDKVIPVNADVWTIKSIQTEFDVSEEFAIKFYKYVLSASRVRRMIIGEISFLISLGLAHNVIEEDD